MKVMKVGCDIVGNICVMKFDRSTGIADKKKFAETYMKKHKAITTVLEKIGKFSGRLRTHKTKFLAGERTKEALYKENGCVFRFNVDTCYFSPRLSSERKEIAQKIKRNENVLVMFGGVAPYAIVIAKLSKANRVVSVELGRECNKYAKVNVKRNKLQDRVEIVQGDVRKVLSNLPKNNKFDRIVMARPNLKDSFLDVAFKKIVKGGFMHYYGFSPSTQLFKTKLVQQNSKLAYQSSNSISKGKNYDSKSVKTASNNKKEVSELKELVLDEAEKARKKIRILKVKKFGGIGPYRFRYRVDLKVL